MRSSGLGRGLSDTALKRWLTAPTLLFLIGMVVYPFLWAVYLSFTDYSILKAQKAVWVGAANYRQILSDPLIWSRFVFTFRFVVVAVGLQLLIGFALAYFLNRRFKRNGFLVTVLLLPMMLSPVVIGLFWKFILANNWGILNYYLKTWFGLPEVLWLSNQLSGYWALVIVDTWMWSPFMMLLSLAGLSAVPEYLYESAEIDRASGWFKFRHLTLPLTAPLVLIAVLFRTIDAFKLFDLVNILTGGGPGSSTETVSMFVYKLAFSYFQTGKASALAVILLVMVIGLSNLYIRALTRVQAS